IEAERVSMLIGREDVAPAEHVLLAGDPAALPESGGDRPEVLASRDARGSRPTRYGYAEVEAPIGGALRTSLRHTIVAPTVRLATFRNGTRVVAADAERNG